MSTVKLQTPSSVRIPLARPDITSLERDAVMRVLNTNTLSLGPELPAFEQELADCAGVGHAVAVNSGTSALHLAMLALGVGPGDEVITTPFSFIASSNCILFVGAKPVFADIDPQTLCLNPDKVEEKITPNTRAVLAVDVFGHPAKWDALERLAARHDLALIEDSAEAIGAGFNGRRAGGFGDAAIFAFYPNKQVTTGEGGALLTNDSKVAEMARSLRSQGRAAGGGWLHHERLGFNFRLSDINCALGRAQLARLPELLARRARVASRYTELLSQVEEVRTPYVDPSVTMSWFVYVIRLAPSFTHDARDRMIESMRTRGIQCGNYFPGIHLEPFYRRDFGYAEGDFPVTESVAARTIALPFYGTMTDQEIEDVVAALKESLAAA
jgi:perosamine synthetase